MDFVSNLFVSDLDTLMSFRCFEGKLRIGKSWISFMLNLSAYIIASWLLECALDNVGYWTFVQMS